MLSFIAVAIVASGQKPGPDAVVLVDRRRAAITGDEFRPASGCSCGNEGVICSATGHVMFRQAENEGPMGWGTQAQKWLGEPSPNEVADYCTGTAMRGRQPREDRVRFERTVLDQAHAAIEHPPSQFMMLMPGCKRSDHQAGVRRLHLRTRSNVSRT